MKRDYTFEVNGFEITASYHDEAVEQIFLPMLKKWSNMQKETGKRVIVFVSAPPGSGKTTVCQFLEYLAKKEEICEVQAVGLDGFHYHQDYILEHTVRVNGTEVPMKAVKGCPETYDVDWFVKKLAMLREGDTRWPVYSRTLHDVVEEAVEVTSPIVLIEGNWLLSSEEPWPQLEKYCDDSVFIYAGEEILRERLIQRKMKGGLNREEAEEFYEKSDGQNVKRLLRLHRPGRMNLQIQLDGNYRICDSRSIE